MPMDRTLPAGAASLDRLVPVTVVTGYLGSGKSSFLNGLLNRGLLADAAFVVNEFGQIPIDHMLIETPQEAIAITTQGCLCCAVGDDLEQTLQNLFMKRLRGIIPDFRSLVIETSGLDSPGKILETLFNSRVIQKRYWFSGVITVVDALNAEATLMEAPEATAQLAVADLVALSKTDIASAGQAAAARKLVDKVNPSALVAAVRELGDDPAPLSQHALLVAQEDMDAGALAARRPLPAALPAHAHAHGVESLAYTFSGPTSWTLLREVFQRIGTATGPALLRAKGIVAVSGFDRPVSLQAVRGLLYPPEFLAPSRQGQAGHVVFIGRDLPLRQFDAAMAQLGATRAHSHQQEGAA